MSAGSFAGGPPHGADAVVIGAGIVGACCALELTRAGLRVCLVDRGAVASGTTGSGEGNILVSDKDVGPELDLALASNRLWRDLAPDIGDEAELDAKGGLVVAATDEELAGLLALAGRQGGAGVATQPVSAEGLVDVEPHLRPGLAGGVLYPQDLQVQPMIAATRLVERATAEGALVALGAEVVAIDRVDAGEVTGVRTTLGAIKTPLVVNAAGTWSGQVAALAGVSVPVLPRRGFILVTEPLPPMIRHKVYTAAYVANVASDDAALETSTVVEGTRAGTILVGASRERVGFDRTMPFSVLATLAAGAVGIFPFLARVRMMRAYGGFRPYCPDHLPVIGPDRRVPGLFHACGHEGAGIGLAPVTGRLIAQAATGAEPDLDLSPFAPDRFEVAHAP